MQPPCTVSLTNIHACCFVPVAITCLLSKSLQARQDCHSLCVLFRPAQPNRRIFVLSSLTWRHDSSRWHPYSHSQRPFTRSSVAKDYRISPQANADNRLGSFGCDSMREKDRPTAWYYHHVSETRDSTTQKRSSKKSHHRPTSLRSRTIASAQTATVTTASTPLHLHKHPVSTGDRTVRGRNRPVCQFRPSDTTASSVRP